MLPRTILTQFNLPSAPVKIHRWGEGHIHDTYLVETTDHNPDYILQKINHHIFKDIPGMMSNIEAVTRHLQKKLRNLPGKNRDFKSLELVYTKSGRSFIQDEEGNSWRMFVFIPGTITYQVLTSPSLGHEAGKAVGTFQSMLGDLETELVETIPDFHNINLRINQYYQAKAVNSAGRVAVAREEIAFAQDRFARMKDYFGSLKDHAILRITHNDTKLNNILFDRQERAICLIDLDTVMPGYVHFDYGDALRTMANTAAEDEKDLLLVKFNKKVYDLFTEGYLESAGEILNEKERELLPYAPVYLTFIIGLRFLTDFLNGDVYYRIHRPEHNLDRARVQFQLVSEIEAALS